MSLSVLLLTLHLIGVGMVVGTVFATLIFVYKNLTDPTNLTTHQTVRKLGMYGAGLAIVTGIIMAWRFRIPIIGNWLFDAKLILILIDGIIAERVIKHQIDASLVNKNSPDLRSKLLGWAWISIIVIVAVIAISVYRGKLHG